MDTLQTLSEACRTKDSKVKQAALKMAYNIVHDQQRALRKACDFLERISGDGYGGEHEYEVALDATREALKQRTLWPSNLDPTAWGEK